MEIKTTNNSGISQSLFDAIVAVNSKYTKGGADFSATELISPARIRVLKAKYADKLQEDVTDMVWRFMGHLVHGAIANMDNKNVLSEERVFTTLYGYIITGSPDRYDGNIITDYKCTSKYAVKDGVKDEWETQLNIYDYLLFNNGFNAMGGLYIEAILKDAVRDEPKVVRLQARQWGVDKTEDYITGRINAHVAAKTNLPECTKEERWATDDKWAVMKKGRKSAVKLYDNRVDCDYQVAGLGVSHYAEHRRGESKRCKDYCIVNKYCDQYQDELKQ